MVSNYTSLNNFICPVPICQPEADLGSILNIFQRLNCKMLAIPQGCGDWGIINAEDLLSLMAEVWLGKQTALASQSKKITFSQNIAHVTTQDFYTLIKPVMVYQAEIEIEEFLNHYDSILNNQSECLIVDSLGKLQGRLDQTKLINYLTQESTDRSSNTAQCSTSLSYLSNLIDAIALPLKIKTRLGEDLYQNKCWQQLIPDNSSLPSPPKETKIDETTWGQWKQRSPTQPEYEYQELDSHSSCSYIVPRNFDLNSASERIPLTDASPSSPSQNLGEKKFPELNLSDLEIDIEIEQILGWNYLKFPLVEKLKSSGISNNYCLVLATKAAPKTPSQPPETCLANSSEIVTNKLLATVSHELKSPLTGIVGLSSLLQEQKLGQLNQRQTRYVQLIHRSGQKMVSIIDDLLQITSLAAEELLEPELINLEFLCRQLYQQALTKVKTNVTMNSDLVVAASEIELHIESGSEIAIANKLLLSGVISHLILETMQVAESLENLNIKISNSSGATAITISSDFTESRAWSSIPESTSSSLPNSGLDIIIAEYLAKVFQGNITTTYLPNYCQFTLLLPKKLGHNQLLDTTTSTTTLDLKEANLQNVTILCLYPESEATAPEANYSHSSRFNLKSWSDNNEQQRNYQHRIIEADSLEQAHTLARIWQLDVIVLDSYQIINPAKYLRSLQESTYLATLPLITLDTKTTEAANQIEGLKVYPCLLPAKHCRVEDLMQVIQIATGA